jgi:CsoR family transcriptional regulator, copper-sensing transcriptional repressor
MKKSSKRKIIMDLNGLEEFKEESKITGRKDEPVHEHHQQVISRLARIEGHVRAIKRMVEEDTSCPDVLVQIAAVRSALNSVGRVILEDHLQSCMVQAVEKDDYQQALRDLKNSLDRFIG